MVYKWKYGISGVSAQDTGEYFECLEKREGEIKPKTIVEEARPDDALLHSAFEWDDSEAAEKYREQQAKQIIRNVVVVQKKEGESLSVFRAIVNVSPKDNNHPQTGKYVSITTAEKSEEMRSIVLRNAISDLRAFKAKYQGISELIGVFSEIEKLGEELN